MGFWGDLLAALGLLGRKKPAEKPAPTPEDCPPVMQYLTMWLPNGGGATTEGTATLQLDQFGADSFVATKVPGIDRIQFTLPSNTNLYNGGDLYVTGVPGCAPYHTRVQTTTDGLWNEVAPPGNIDLPPAHTWQPAPREWAGNMCGVIIPGIGPVPGGSSAQPDLVLSWFYDRYDDWGRARIRADWQSKGLFDVVVSWPDSRAAGKTPEQFGAMCRELLENGFRPCPFLYSKDYDPSDVPEIERRMAEVLPHLIGVVNRVCVGWELSIALSPAQVQELTDWLSPQIVTWGCKLYVHFQEGYASFDIDGPNASFAGYWNRNIGKLHGVLHQRKQTGRDQWDEAMYQARLVDILQRFAGQYNCSPDSGFGCPFDCIALEIKAMDAYAGTADEAEQNRWARVAVTTPPVDGPFGPVRVMGSGNGVA